MERANLMASQRAKACSGTPALVRASLRPQRGLSGRRAQCSCAAQKGGAQAPSMAVGSKGFENVDNAFGALKDWDGNPDTFKMETDLTKLCDPDELAEKRREFDALLETYNYSFKPGDRVVGLVLSVGKRGAQVEIGAKLPAHCPSFEMSTRFGANAKATLRAGTEREFQVIPSNRPNSEMLCVSARVVDSEIAWRRVRQLSSQDAIVSVMIKQITRGGALVEFEGIQGFMPKSHLGMDLESASDLIGSNLNAKFLEADPEASRLVVSHRMARSSNQKSLDVGSVVAGRVVAVKDYGAFVDLGLEFNALLHVSQISYNRLFTVDQVLSVGDEIKAMVLSFDASRGRVSLSTKKLEMEPGEMLRNPAKVFENAESMAKQFRERVAAAEAVARASAKEEPPAPKEDGDAAPQADAEA